MECLICKKPIQSNRKFCSTSCSNRNRKMSESDKLIHSERMKAAMSRYYDEKLGEITDVDRQCIKCGKIFTVKTGRKILYEKTHCSMRCSNSRIRTEEIKNKIASSLTKEKEQLPCKGCGQIFIKMKKHRMFCSKSCSAKYNSNLPEAKERNRIRMLKTLSVVNKRSKNEIHFATLCEQHFNTVKLNCAMFNGWDADIVIEDLKVAVMWNGKWHYEKLTKKHSVLQVQNRDKIKLHEIIKSGYTSYVIKDMGKEDKKFVEEQFKIFIHEFCWPGRDRTEATSKL